MSKESLLDLNRNTLIGFGEKRRNLVDPYEPGESVFDDQGRSWHYREELQGDEPNHYPGAIPIEDVRRRLFFWKPVEGPVKTEFTVITAEGVETVEVVDPERKTIIRPDTKTILGIFKSGYQIHDYDEWLLKSVATLIDDDLAIGSAGLLKKGGVAWVQIEMPDSITTPEGVIFRPHLLAATSLDGSLSTTYQRCVTNVVCDNTMSAALGEAKDQRIKIKHSRYSKLKLGEARSALAIVHTIAENFAEEVAALCSTKVSAGDWEKFMDEIAPVKTEDGEDKTGRGLTMAENTRAEYAKLWNHDDRVAPWKGTAWGVVQAVNTYTHHIGIVRGADRAERNRERAVMGGADKLDKETLKTLTGIL